MCLDCSKSEDFIVDFGSWRKRCAVLMSDFGPEAPNLIFYRFVWIEDVQHLVEQKHGMSFDEFLNMRRTEDAQKNRRRICSRSTDSAIELSVQ